jgi:nitroreductase
MTRTFTAAPVDPGLLDDLLDLARRAPSAGFSQGVHFVVLAGPSLDRFWELTGAGEWFAERQPGVLRAPVVVLPVGDPGAYTQRYAEPDKAGHGLERAEGWEVQYWLTDAAMATENLLLLCEAHDLGALFFGIFRNANRLMADLGAPVGAVPIGAVAIGHRDAADAPSGSPRTRPRLPADAVIHHDRW